MTSVVVDDYRRFDRRPTARSATRLRAGIRVQVDGPIRDQALIDRRPPRSGPLVRSRPRFDRCSRLGSDLGPRVDRLKHRAAARINRGDLDRSADHSAVLVPHLVRTSRGPRIEP